MITNLTVSDVNSKEESSLFVYFKLGSKSYAIHTSHTIEILKLAKIEIPQKLPALVMGVLNYNNMTINVIDLRSALNLSLEEFKTSNQIIVLKTQESIFAIVVDEVLNILSIPHSEMNIPPYNSQSHLIKMLYNLENDVISIVDLYALEELVSENQNTPNENNYELFFPKDEKSLAVLQERSKFISKKDQLSFFSSIYNQDQFLIFNLAKNIYCLNLKYVKEIVALKNLSITKLPFAPNYIVGIINLHGDFLTVLNMKEFFKVYSKHHCESKNIIIIDSKDFKLGLLVDGIKNIASINHDKFIHKSSSKFNSKYVMAEIVEENEIYNILNVEKFLNDEKLFVSIE
ncbi:MAG: chemotaxis protein CheW [Candidatus Gastranaerophilales bacterium]|nr:chemotaxis protein CheW [Candidatus Gastranaerophilales bacterium]